MSRRHYIDNAPTPTFGPIGTTDTSFVVSAATGLPVAVPFNATLDLGTASQENVSVTGVSGTTLTVTRNIDGLGAFSHAAGATLNHTALAIDFDEANAHVNATTGVHGVTGAVVGTTDTQTLSNKTIAGFTGTANSGVVGITVTGDNTGDLIDLKNGSTTVAKFDKDGKLTAAQVTTGGTAAVTGAATFGSTVGITGTTTAAAVNATNVAASGTLGVTGVSTLHGVTATTVAASGNSTIGGTLGIAGATTAAAVSATTLAASSTLAVTGAATFSSTGAFTGAVTGASFGGRHLVPVYTNEAARDAAITSPSAGDIVRLTSPTSGGKGQRAQTYSGSAWVNDYAGSYNQTGSNVTVSASLTSCASVSLPPGVWCVHVDGVFVFSTATSRDYSAQIYDSTNATAVGVMTVNSGSLNSSMPVSLTRIYSNTATATVQFRVSTATTDGTQNFTNPTITVTAAGPAN